MRSILRFLLVPVILGITAVGSLAFEAPALKGRVNDYAELLTPMQRNTLEDALRALEEKTTAQVAILTVKDLGEAKDPVVLSQKVFETWKLGQKDKNNGLLIFYTATEDRFRLHTGYGMEVIIPDGAAGTILREHFRRWAPQKKEPKDFYKAFTTTVEAVSKRIEAAHEAKQAPPPASGALGLNLWHLILTVGVFVLAVFAGRASASPGFSAMVGGLGEGGVALFFYSMPLAVVAGVVGAGLAAAVAAMLVSSQRSAVMRPVYEGRAPASRAPQRSSGRSRPAAAASKPQRTARREKPRRRRQDDDFPVVAPVDYGSSSRSSSSDDSFSSSSGGFSGGGGDSGGGGAGD